jgi:hypothetical protein
MTMPYRVARHTRASAFAGALLWASSGCCHVSAYQRGILAHPTMNAADPYTTQLADHVQSVSEGAAGGLAGGGGGCGCN